MFGDVAHTSNEVIDITIAMVPKRISDLIVYDLQASPLSPAPLAVAGFLAVGPGTFAIF